MSSDRSSGARLHLVPTEPKENPGLGGGFSVTEICEALDGARELRRALAAWLLILVDREVRIALRPIAVRYRRDLRDAAEDLVQDVMIVLFHQDGKVLRAWDPDRGMQLRSFVSLVVRRTILRRFKGFRGNPWSTDPTDAFDLAASLDDGIVAGPSVLADIEYRMQLDMVLSTLHASLTEREWRLFTKLYVEQRTPADVGSEEGMKENNVHKWCSRFQQRARQIFGRPKAPPPASPSLHVSSAVSRPTEHRS